MSTAVTVYLDESAIDGGSPYAVVAGILLNQDRFLHMDLVWNNTLDKHGLRSLHMKDFGIHGTRAHWNDRQRLDLFSDVESIINEHKLYSIAATLSVKDFKAFIHKEIREEMGLYGTCFILAAYINHYLAKENSYEKKIAYLLDDGAPHRSHVNGAHAALALYQGVTPMHVGSLTFVNDENVSALQAADVIAWSARRRISQLPFTKGFEPLETIFNEAHVEQTWRRDLLEKLGQSESLLSAVREMRRQKALL